VRLRQTDRQPDRQTETNSDMERRFRHYKGNKARNCETKSWTYKQRTFEWSSRHSKFQHIFHIWVHLDIESVSILIQVCFDLYPFPFPHVVSELHACFFSSCLFQSLHIYLCLHFFIFSRKCLFLSQLPPSCLRHLHDLCELAGHTGMSKALFVHLCVCMCVYMCVCVYVHVCVYVGMYVCMCVCAYVYMYVCMYVCIYVCMYVRMCMPEHYYSVFPTPLNDRVPRIQDATYVTNVGKM